MGPESHNLPETLRDKNGWPSKNFVVPQNG